MNNPKPHDAARLSAGAFKPAASVSWRAVVDRCEKEAGPFRAGLPAAWRADIDAVEAMVRKLEAKAPRGAATPDDASSWPADGRAGVHALVAIAVATAGSEPIDVARRPPVAQKKLRDVACAVELAYRAVRYHDAISDSLDEAWAVRRPAIRASNRRQVLGGDWSITEAAVLVANISPAAYRILVRGYGAAQMAGIEGRLAENRGALLRAAASLGALIVDASDGERGLALAALAWRDDSLDTSEVIDGIDAVDASGPIEARGASGAVRVCRWAARMMPLSQRG